jgi:YYY domain-containing protein
MSLPEFFAIIRWWLVLLLLGSVAFPLSFTIFKKLPDRGYAFTKMFGLLLVAYVYWITGSLGFLGNNTGGIIVSIVVVGLMAYWIYRRSIDGDQASANLDKNIASINEQPIGSWVRNNWTQILWTELVFAALFLVWVWVRSQNPAIAATEKPMEFAFLNSIGRSPYFPPLDPWLSGYAISYYYFGYVMTSLIARLAHVPEQIAFNLALAWLIAGAGTGAFGMVFNLLRLQGARRSAMMLGLVAALAIPVVGNLTIGLEVAHANNLGSAEFWQWLDVRDLNEAPVPEALPRYESSSWWWWRSSRPLHEYYLSGRPEEGLEPIAEFPGFSFILGDLHAHVLALPFAFLSLATALVWWLPRGKGADGGDPLAEWDSEGFFDHFQSSIRYIGTPLWLTSGLILGGLAFLNTWDVLIYLFVILGAFLLARWRDEGWQSRHVTQVFYIAGLLLIPAVLLYMPFFLGFRSQAGAPYLLPMLMRPTRLVQWLIIFGMPLWAIIIFLLALVSRQRFRYWQTGLLTILVLFVVLFGIALLFSFIVAASNEGAGIVINLAGELGTPLAQRPDQAFAIGWAISSIVDLLPTYIGARISYGALALFLTSILGMVVMIWRETLTSTGNVQESASPKARAENNVLPFVLLLIATGALLTLGPEFIYLRDNFGQRINTIFKFYYQAWVMFGVAALYAVGYLWLAWRGSKKVVPILATAGYTLAFLVASLFPIYAVNSRAMEYRGPVTAEGRQPATLDGLAQMALFNPGDYAAVLWLDENAAGTPVVLEAVGGQYTNYGRISSSSGLPTILGWPGHEYQWRGATPEPAVREPIVTDIYTTPNLENVAALLDSYNVRYIVVGGMERDRYGLAGMDKFSENLDVAFESDGVTIYYWTPQ